MIATIEAPAVAALNVLKQNVKALKLDNTLFTLEREGDFTVETYGDHHCGTKNPLNIKFLLACTCTADSLDERGFLFDQNDVQKFFDGLKKVNFSCENLAKYCARKLFRLILSANGKCKITAIRLTLSPEPYKARLTFAWTQPKAECK